MSARALVTGFAWLEPAPDAVAHEGWLRLPDPRREEIDPGKQDTRYPKLDRASRLLALVARRALEGRAVAGDLSALVLATVTGSLEADERFDATRAQEGGASPLLFPATLATAPAAELSIRLGLRGPVEVVSSGDSSLLAAITTGLLWLTGGEATLVLACGLEVAARSAGHALGRAGPFAESALCLVLEREPSEAALASIELDRSPARAPLEGRPELLGNAAGPTLARAIAASVRGPVNVGQAVRVSAP